MNANTQIFFNLIALLAVSCCIKVLLMPAYFSTDFEVHQNWLRITNTKGMAQWYFDNESKWTLDYPPFFAYFQWLLSAIANLYDPQITSTINKHINTVFFQRVSVIVSQIPLLITLYYLIGSINYKLVISYLFIPFIILDNIHFQYNIIMQAIFILSIYFIQQEKYLKGAFTYACLLNFKHIYLYAAIAFASYLLKHYVLKPQNPQQKIANLVKLAFITILPFALSFLPFLLAGGFEQIQQIISRLFPFQRGLIHEYWAPNFWALYYFMDKILNIFGSKLFLFNTISFKQVNGQLHQLKLLPTITPLITTVLILLATAPIVIKLVNHNVKFHKLVFICGCIFFMFGFHVHEKAITPYLSLLFIFLQQKEQKEQKQNSLHLNEAIFVNIINLIPLLIDDNEKLLKIFLPLLWLVIWDFKRQINTVFEILILTCGILIIMYHEIMHPFVKSSRLQFLPLMLNSVFSAAFNISWIAIIYYNEIKSKQHLKDNQIYQQISSDQS